MTSNMANDYGISLYSFSREIQLFCPLGNDFYTCEMLVEFYPDELIFDFCDVDNFIKQLGGEKMIVEAVVNEVFKYLQNFKPKKLMVIGRAKSNTHFDVSVTKVS